MFQELRAAFTLLIFLTLLTGLGYPMLTTAAGQAFFPNQANGSLISEDDKIIGSEIIGQNFISDKYFNPRPSAAGKGYDAANSSGSNLAITSKKWLALVDARVKELRKKSDNRPIPVDLVTASGSGLDPDISVSAAKFQAVRIAKIRGISLQQVEKLIALHTTPRTFGVLGEKRVNVLKINRALDRITSLPKSRSPTP